MGNDGFRQTLNGKYVDKTDLIRYVNDILDTNVKLTCISRTRRLGKTLAFIPRQHTKRPAMIVELKYGKIAETALKHIKEKNYAGALQEFTGNMLLVGINYEKDKGHTYIIEKYEKK